MSDLLPPDIAAILAFNETGSQFFKRVQQERVLTGMPIIDSNLSLRPGVVLEVAGPSGSGKTELLLSIALHVLLSPYADPNAWLVQPPPSLLPQQHHHQQLGPDGQGQQQQQQQQQPSKGAGPENRGSVVIFDLDSKFDGVRLMQVLEPQVHSAWRDQQQQRLAARGRPRTGGGGGGGGSGPGPQDAASGIAEQQQQQMLSPDQVVDEVLSRLHLVRCRSSLQLLAALAGLPTKLQALQAAGSPCRLLLVDNVGSHYWRDRAARNVVAPRGGGGAGGAHQPYHQAVHHHHQQQQQQQQQQPLALSLFEMHAAIAARLAHVSRRHRLPVVATKTAAVTAKGLDAGGGGGGFEVAAAAVVGQPLGEGEVQLQQREFMPMPWQNVVTHRLLLYPRGVVPGPAAPGTQHAALQSLTAILSEMLGGVGQQAAAGATAAAAGAGATVAAAGPGGLGGTGGGGGSGGGRGVGQLLVSSVAMVQDW
ncbi:hypothetical protein PLESTF_001079300 [Pleodorina starrii]|nr:hypothetical protein PLESTM_001154800 [Pleodorina starrii]GLC71144.1 hypothetical protein PLESTF_001079300 [Pleodorina starrii]